MKKRPALLSTIGFTFVLLAILSISLTAQAAPTVDTPAQPLAPADNTYQALPFSQAWTTTTLITTNDDWSGVPGIVGYLGDFFPSSTTAIPDPRTIISDTTGVAVDVNANQTNPNTLTTGGVAEFDTLTDPVVALQGSGTADAPFILLHLNTTGLANVTISYNLRDIDGSADNAVQAVALQYRVGSTGIFTNVAAGFVADATTGPNLATLVTPVTATLPSVADNQSQVQVRVITSNAAGNDEWVGIDDISVTGTPLVDQPDLAVAKSGPAAANAGDAITYTISLSNTGTATATLSVLTDTLPAEVSFVTYTTAAPVTFTHPSATQLVWQLGDVLTTTPEISIQVQGVITTNVTNGTVVTNTAVATTASPESNLGNNISQVTTTVSSSIVPDVEIYVQKSGPAVVFGGELISYTIVYGNNGTQSVTATLTDTLPISFTVADIAFNDGPPNPIDNTNTRSWTATLASGDRFTFTLALTVPTAIANNTLITNTIAITATGAGNNPNNDLSAASSIVYQIVPISDARAGSNGQIFAIEGQVIVVPNTYSASEWELQDSSGAIAMFYSSPPAVSLGDHIRVVAPRSTFSGQQQLGTPLYFQNLGPGTHVTPRPFQTGQIAAGTAQGWLAVISGTLSNLTTCTGNYDLFVNDGSGAADVFINSFSGSVINPCAQGFTNGDWVSVTGFSTIFSSTTRLVYEVRPRSMSDLVRYPRVLNVSPANNATGVAVAAPITAAFNLTMTNVGAATFLLENAAGAVAGAVSYDTATRVATFTPTAALAFNTRYTATLKSTLQASNGLTLMPAQDYVWTFITYQPQPNLSIAKTVATVSDPVELGAVVTYTFTLSNTGDGAATSVLITDVLPSAVNFGGFVQQNSATYSSGTITWSGSLNAGAAATVIFTATVKNDKTLYGTDVMNTVQFTSGNGGSGSANIAFAIVKHYFIYLPLIQR